MLCDCFTVLIQKRGESTTLWLGNMWLSSVFWEVKCCFNIESQSLSPIIRFQPRRVACLSLSRHLSPVGVVDKSAALKKRLGDAGVKPAEAIYSVIDELSKVNVANYFSAHAKAFMGKLQRKFLEDSKEKTQQNNALKDEVAELKRRLDNLENSRGKILLRMFMNNITDILGVYAIGEINPRDRSGRSLSELLHNHRGALQAFIDEKNLQLSLDDLENFCDEITSQRLFNNREAHPIIFDSESDMRMLHKVVQNFPQSKKLYEMRAIRDELVAYENRQGPYTNEHVLW